MQKERIYEYQKFKSMRTQAENHQKQEEMQTDLMRDHQRKLRNESNVSFYTFLPYFFIENPPRNVPRNESCRINGAVCFNAQKNKNAKIQKVYELKRRI
jgi:hypothetical protein